MVALYGALAAGILWGFVILIRETVRGFKLKATKRSVIICIAFYGIFGISSVVLGIMGIVSGVNLIALIPIGLVELALAFGLVYENFINKGNSSGETVDNVSVPKAETNKSSPANSEWICPNCGKINQNYVGSCGCGTTKPK